VNASANELLFRDETAGRISCLTASGRTLGIRADRFVFASGTLATSRFFLTAQRYHPVPWRNNRNIGLYFQDHLGGKIARARVLNERRFRDFFENGWVDGIKLQPKLSLSAQRRAALPSGVCGAFTFDSSVAEHLGNVKRTIRGIRSGLSFSSVSGAAVDAARIGRSVLPLITRYLRSRRIFALFDQGLHFNVQAEQIPVSSSSILLRDADRCADGLGPLEVDWKCDGRELEAIHEFAVESDAYLRANDLAALTIDPALERRDTTFMDTLSDTYHQCGGMRMSSSAGGGVVDADCRVWGTRNVWVAGSSVFPSSSHANCTLTALALAARLAAHLQ
jgi:hypothetical protein